MNYIIGSDEVGYGAWAGPLVVCAAAVPFDWKGPVGLADSKDFSTVAEKAKRVALYAELQHLPMSIVGIENTVIDRFGVGDALIAAHEYALKQMLQRFPGAEVIVDGSRPIPGVPQARCIPKADSTYPVVMAASIIAKVNRDLIMREYHKKYPHYGFDTNVGYGQKRGKHADGLKSHGVCPIHRRSYQPIKDALANGRQMKLFGES